MAQCFSEQIFIQLISIWNIKFLRRDCIEGLKKKKKGCHISSQIAVNMDDQTLKQNSRSVSWWMSTETHYKGRQPGPVDRALGGRSPGFYTCDPAQLTQPACPQLPHLSD